VVATSQIDTVRCRHFEEKKRNYDFGRKGASIDKVSIEKVGISRAWVSI
jgi:hypothetical protein